MGIKRLIIGTTLMFSINGVGPAYAEQGGPGQYNFLLGGGATISPDYEGSDDYDLQALPVLSLGWESDPVIPTGGTGLQLGLHDIKLILPKSLDMGLAKLYRSEGVYRAHVGVSYNGGREQDDNAALNGMGDIDSHAMAIVGINFDAEDSGWQAAVKFEQAISSDDYGSVVTGEIGYELPLAKSLTLTPAVHTTWASDDHMQTYFGVSQAQAATSSHSRYDAGAGVKSAGIGAELNWKITEHWMMNTNVGYTKLTGDAADSPLVENEGSSDQLEAMMMVMYRF